MSGFDLHDAAAGFVGGEVPAQLSAWLATYLVHGVCLFLVAAVVVRVIKSARASEQLWRAALFGPLLTASLQLGAGLNPAFGLWELPDAVQDGTEAQVVRTASPEITYLQALEGREQALLARIDKLGNRLALVVEGADESSATVTPIVRQAPASVELSPSRRLSTALALLIVAAGIAALMMRAVLETIRMRRLGKRRPLKSGPIVDMVLSLSQSAGIQRRIRVEVTASGASPYATGVIFPKIVVPERAIAELDAPSMQAMLAHEMGHVARLDPLWTAAARSVATLFFLQPLNWFLVRRLDECAEYCCDEFAVDVTGNEVAMARCLTTVAEWILGGNSSVRAACPMAHRNSPLASRVSRILETEGQPQLPLGPLRWIGGAVVLTTAMAAPGFAARTAAEAPLAEAPLAGVLVTETPLPEPHALELQPRSIPMRVTVRTPPSPGSPLAVFETLESTVHGLGTEIDALISVARQRTVSHETIERLTKLRARANRIGSHARAIQQRIAATVR